MSQFTRQQLAAYIDHTLLKPEATPADIEKLCREAAEHQFASVCVNPVYVQLAGNLLQDSPVLVCTVVGFPLGANTPAVKQFETLQALNHGATEIDMVINIGALKAGEDDLVQQDIALVSDTAHNAGAICKVIIETVKLTADEKVRACQLAQKAGADFVKTSTGFGGGGATEADVILMRRTVGDTMQVKASGGIRNYEQAMAMIAAGANRLGASAGKAILEGIQA